MEDSTNFEEKQNHNSREASPEIPDEFLVDITPDVAALRMFRNMSFTAWYALGEFVDNSITSALKNHEALKRFNGPDYQLNVSIEFPEGSDSLVVQDNAAGISYKEMQRALKTGIPPEDDSIGLSKHGVGLKAAALWWGSKVVIETFPLDEEKGWKVEIDVSAEGSIGQEVKVKSIKHRGFPGTKIIVNDLWQKTPQSKTVSSIKAYLPSIYRAFIGGDHKEGQLKCRIVYESEELKFEYPKLLTAPLWVDKIPPNSSEPHLLWRKDIKVQLKNGQVITGWVGILERLSRDLSGFFLHYRGKGIAGVVPLMSRQDIDSGETKDAISKGSYKPRKIFGQPGSYTDQSFIGEFDITEFGKTITTDSPLWTPEQEDEFVTDLYNKMNSHDFIRMATNYKRRLVSKIDEDEQKKSDKNEQKKIESALDGKIDHTSSTEGSSEIKNDDGIEVQNEENLEPSISITLHDAEEHIHVFSLNFVKDVSRPFITLYEDHEKRKHVAELNLFHPSLDGIMIDIQNRKLLQRIGIGLIASEVFVDGWDKSKIRNKLNDIMQNIGNNNADAN